MPTCLSTPYSQRVIGWARTQEPIRALVVTGSLARDDGTVDAFSDLDLQVIADDCDAFIRDDGWLDDIGEVWIRFPLNQTVPYRLVWFKGRRQSRLSIHQNQRHPRDDQKRRPV